MRTKTLLTSVLTILAMAVSAQKPSITLTFTAENNGQYVPLDSIRIENLTQGGDTTLYDPDTVLLLNFLTGYGENISTGNRGLTISQNYPNPIQGKTTINIYVAGYENVRIRISDILGRELINSNFSLEPGIHTFTFIPGSENFYFLTTATDQEKQCLKMFNSPIHAASSGICEIEYCGKQNEKSGFKSGKELNGFVFSLGDSLEFIASSNPIERTIIDSPTTDTTYIFQFSPLPCPGTPTVTDMDGNVYNTVLIGNQCWMAENLKTTTYRNGTPIPNVISNSGWSGLNTGAYCWYENDITWKAKYGALYNWYSTVDANGLCPSGWHVPTKTEWTDLTDFIGGPANGKELKSCRQVNSPLGEGCNTTVHPRWNSNIVWGTDNYGFSGLPGGFRDSNGSFNWIGYDGSWWSLPQYSFTHGWHLYLTYNLDYVEVETYYKQGGFSVRCLKNSESFPTADFSGNPTSGNAPLIVNFHDLSSNTPTSWQWNFGDGGTSTLQNTSHIYNAAGNYTVQLTATNSFGSDTKIKTNYITVTTSVNAPVANFSGTPTSGNAPLTVNFTDLSSNTPTSWQWVFGDGGTSTLQNPSHTYNAGGTYTVQLTAINSYGSDTEIKTNYITISPPGNPPVANFSGTPTSGVAPLTVNFTDLSSNTPTSWQWSFGDGGTSTQQNPSHIYNAVGIYTVQLIAANSYGSNSGIKTDYITVTIPGNPPVANFSGTPTSGIAPLTVNFTDLSSNTPTSWQWNFGDGSTSTQQNPSHIYNAAGNYTVQLTANNSYGSDTEIKTDYITVSGGGTGEPCPGTPTVNYEGQVYNTVLIGTQCWLKENLNVGTMINGSSNQTNNGQKEKYCYNNNAANCSTYGGLYQWNEMMGYTTTQGVQGICPPGWHIPTDEEWNELEGAVDSQYGYPDPEWNGTGWRGFDAGLNLKSTVGWNSGGNGTGLYGFGALPGGFSNSDGSFFTLGFNGYWWSSSEDSDTNAWKRGLNNGYGESGRNSNYKTSGFSVRCLKD